MTKEIFEKLLANVDIDKILSVDMHAIVLYNLLSSCQKPVLKGKNNAKDISKKIS